MQHEVMSDAWVEARPEEYPLILRRTYPLNFTAEIREEPCGMFSWLVRRAGRLERGGTAGTSRDARARATRYAHSGV